MLEWSKEMSTGNQMVDQQHRELIDHYDYLLNICREGKCDKQEVEIALRVLVQATRQHFLDEERLQMESGYPGYTQHKKEHEAFCREMAKMQELMAEKGPTGEVVEGIAGYTGQWLVDHMRGLDSDLAEYLHSRTDAAV